MLSVLSQEERSEHGLCVPCHAPQQNAAEEGIAAGGELIGNVLEASKEILEIVLHVAIPPPGGAVIIACLTAAVCFIKSGINVKELRELTM